MDDLISRIAVNEYLKHRIMACTFCKREGLFNHYEHGLVTRELEELGKFINQCPTVAPAPVIRCKDCKNWIDHGRSNEFNKLCKLAGYYVGGNGYCVYGETRQPVGKTDRLVDAFCRTGRYETEPLKQYGIDLSELFENSEQVEIVPEEEWRELEGRVQDGKID